MNDTKPITPEALERLDALYAKLGSVPWKHSPNQGEGTITGPDDWMVCDAGTAAEADFIVALRNAYPALRALIEQQAQRIAELEAAVRDVTEPHRTGTE